MNLYLLKRRTDLHPHWDVSQGFVVRATDEAVARGIAASNHGDEGAAEWATDDRSSCELIAEGVSGSQEMVLQDFHAG